MKVAIEMAEYAALGLVALDEELQRLPLATLPGVFFRASRTGRSHPPHTSFAYFLPPSTTEDKPVREGRFNDRGQRALYLATSPTILSAEMTQDGKSGAFAVARFDADMSALRIANLLPDATRDFPHVNSLLGEGERKRLPGHEADTDPYAHTVLLRQLLERRHYDGAAYPSVHGAYLDDPSRFNVVLFTESLFERILSTHWSEAHVTEEQFEPVEDEDPAITDARAKKVRDIAEGKTAQA